LTFVVKCGYISLEGFGPNIPDRLSVEGIGLTAFSFFADLGRFFCPVMSAFSRLPLTLRGAYGNII
jgi:hypothetical protein